MAYSRIHREVGRGRLGPVLIECQEWSDFQHFPRVTYDSRLYFNLMDAAQHGDVNLFKILISSPHEMHRDVNKVDGEGFTALHYAVMNGHTEIVRLLLVHGAIVNQSTVDIAKKFHGEDTEIFRLLNPEERRQRKEAATTVMSLGKFKRGTFKPFPESLTRQIAQVIVNPSLTMKAV